MYECSMPASMNILESHRILHLPASLICIMGYPCYIVTRVTSREVIEAMSLARNTHKPRANGLLSN